MGLVNGMDPPHPHHNQMKAALEWAKLLMSEPRASAVAVAGEPAEEGEDAEKKKSDAQVDLQMAAPAASSVPSTGAAQPQSQPASGSADAVQPVQGPVVAKGKAVPVKAPGANPKAAVAATLPKDDDTKLITLANAAKKQHRGK